MDSSRSATTPQTRVLVLDEPLTDHAADLAAAVTGAAARAGVFVTVL